MVDALTQRHRAQQLLLRRATQSQIDKIWPRLQYEDLDGTYPAFALSAAQIVEANRRTSAGLAASYVRNLRRSKRVGGDFQILIPDALVVEQFNASIHGTSVAAIKTAASKATAPELAMQNALAVTRGAAARLVLNAGRDTVTATTIADPKARGWERVLGGAGCDFCRELAGRVYTTEVAGFEAHGGCGCSAEPVYL